MRRLMAIALTLTAVLPVAATVLAVEPSATEQVLRQFGLFGRWAVDCQREAAPDNPHVTDLMAASGMVLERHDLGRESEINHYQIVTAKRLSATRLSLEVIFQPGSDNEQRQHLVVMVRDDTRRTLLNAPEGGPVRVKNGVALGFGLTTPLLRKCE